MIQRVIYFAEADQDIVDSYKWLEEREYGLGEKFLRCLEARILTIRRHPELYPMVKSALRRAPLRRFPYDVFYKVAGDTLIIYSVFHCSQDPGKWQKRLGKL